jgi:hypothetical protein
MKPISTFLLAFLLTAGLHAQSPPPAPLVSYIIAVDTSFSMSRQKDNVYRTVHELLAGGIYGQMKPGERFTVWTFSERVSQRRFPVQAWSPELSRVVCTNTLNLLKGAVFQGETRLEVLVRDINKTAKNLGAVTFFIISDGGDVITGTPFDRALNVFYGKHYEDFRNAKRPFVTTLVAKDGKLAAWSVNPAGYKVVIPALPDEKAVVASETPIEPTTTVAQALPAPATVPPITNAAPANPPAPAPPVAEKKAPLPPIIIRQTPPVAKAQTNLPPPTAPLEVPVDQPPGPSPAPSRTGAESVQQKIDQLIDKAKATSSKPADTEADKSVLFPPPTAEVAPPTSSSPTQADPIPTLKSFEPALAALQAPEAPKLSGTLSSQPVTASTPRPRAAIAATSTSGRGNFLLAGLGLLGMAMLLGWLLFRQSRPAAQRSIITESLKRGGK